MCRKIIILVILAVSLSAQVYECKKIYIHSEKETISATSKIVFDMKKAIIKSKMFDTIEMKYENTEVNGDTYYRSGDAYDSKSFVYHRRNSPYLFFLSQNFENYAFQECKRLK